MPRSRRTARLKSERPTASEAERKSSTIQAGSVPTGDEPDGGGEAGGVDTEGAGGVTSARATGAARAGGVDEDSFSLAGIVAVEGVRSRLTGVAGVAFAG